jgi:hypothetical protein
MIPDLGYYVQFATLARLAHTFRGSILVCLPTGLTLLVTLYALRRPLWFLLPQPHRAVLEPVITARFLLRPSSLVAVAASIVNRRMDAYCLGLLHAQKRLGSETGWFPSRARIPLRHHSVPNL